jgi:endonuclease-8
MPEGHTVHRLARDHARTFADQKLIVLSPQGRFEKEARKLCGHSFQTAEAHGKHLFYRFGSTGGADTSRMVHIHLGLYGKFRVHKNPAPEPRGAVRVRMIGSEKTVDLNGPNRCEILSRGGYQQLRKRLGPDPLRDDADPELVWKRIQRSRAAIGTLLLNQSVIAGVGNVYRAEILYLLGIHPERPGNRVNREEFDRLWDLTVRLMNIGVKYNRIITVNREQVDKPLSRLKGTERLLCYKKQNCYQCDRKIKKWTLGARTMYACGKCQK